MRIELGLPVDCADGPCGTVADLVISPERRIVTHVVVNPSHNHHAARLVPIDDITAGPAMTSLRLRATTAAFERYRQVEETAFVRAGEWPLVTDENWEVGLSTVLVVPALDGSGLEDSSYVSMPYSDGAYVSYDVIPLGEVELRRGSPVQAAEGKTVGRVAGVVLEGDGRISHLVVRRGHLWGRRELTIPVSAVKRLRTDEVDLELTADDVAALPSVRVRRH